jgi:hypothetical protein
MNDEDLDPLIDHADLDGLVRLIDARCETRDWEGLFRIRERARLATETGRQVWPATTLAEYRLALHADTKWAAKVLHEFSKGNERLVIKAGSMPNALMGAADVATLAKMPSRHELLSTLLGTMQAPVATFVRTLNEVPTKFVRALAAVRDQKQQQVA